MRSFRTSGLQGGGVVVVDVRTKVVVQMKSVAGEVGQSLQPLTDDLLLRESGLDSLSVAVLFAYLEDELHVDPFGAGGCDLPMTVGDLIKGYEDAIPGSVLVCPDARQRKK